MNDFLVHSELTFYSNHIENNIYPAGLSKIVIYLSIKISLFSAHKTL